MPQPLVAHYLCDQEVPVLETHRRLHYPSVVVHEVAGEVDVATAPALRVALDGLLATTDGCIVVDLSRMTFIDGSGLSVLAWFATAMAGAGRPTVLQGARPFPARVLAITGIAARFGQADGLRW